MTDPAKNKRTDNALATYDDTPSWQPCVDGLTKVCVSGRGFAGSKPGATHWVQVHIINTAERPLCRRPRSACPQHARRHRLSGRCKAVFPTGTKVRLMWTGYAGFSGWSGDCAQSTSRFCELAMDQDRPVDADFVPASGVSIVARAAGVLLRRRRDARGRRQGCAYRLSEARPGAHDLRHVQLQQVLRESSREGECASGRRHRPLGLRLQRG